MPFSQHLPHNPKVVSSTCEDSVNIANLTMHRVRKAIQENEVSFPSQVPIFPRQSRASIQWRAAELYFVCNWSCIQLGKRYGVNKERVRQIVSSWLKRAIALGYVQDISVAGRPLTEGGALEEAGLVAGQAPNTPALSAPPPAADGWLSQRSLPVASRSLPASP